MNRAWLRFLGLHRSWLALTAAAMIIASMPGSAAAYSVVSESGLVGEYTINETAESPSVRCVYGSEQPPNWAYLRFVNVLPPTVMAADRNSDKVDSRRVSWQYKLQRMQYPSGSWQTVASSAVQRSTARDNQAASFSAIRVYYNAKKNGLTPDYVMRVLMIIKWYKPSGAVEGTAKITPDYYRMKTPWDTHTSSQAFCSGVATSG